MTGDEINAILDAWGQRVWSLRQHTELVGAQVTVVVSAEHRLMADLWVDQDGEVLFCFRTESGPEGDARVVVRADGSSARE